MENPKICIIGAGFSGICAGIQLQKQLDIDNYVIYDENEDVGGTWLVNTYPGCACDVPSHLYSFSFDPNPYWSKSYSEQEEIWVIETEWDEKICKWIVKVLDTETNKQSQKVFDLVISGVGGLRAPNWPEEFEPFNGPKMHSAQWDPSIKLKDKVVAIVGSGASAVQIIPEIVDSVKRLIVYQRKPSWVVPKLQIAFPNYVQWAFAYVPGVQWALRNFIFWTAEMRHSAFQVNTWLSTLSEKYGQYQLHKQVKDPELRGKLTPDYKFGCKRVTPSNDYYPALCKPNVTLHTSKITQVTNNAIRNEDGTVEKPDVLILATGFKVQEYFSPLKITARGGVDILQKWKQAGPNAYAGIVSHTLPNSFFILGPNTGLGHNTIIFSIECQVNWMIKVIKEMIERNAKTFEIKKSAEDEYMKGIMSKMEKTVWGATKCGSWYADSRGVITTLWPENLIAYYNLTKSVDFSLLEFS